MREISKELADTYYGNLAELFEIMVGQCRFLDVLELSNVRGACILGNLYEISFDAGLCTVSDAVARHKGVRALDECVTLGTAKERYFLYDSLEEAHAHALQLLKEHNTLQFHH